MERIGRIVAKKQWHVHVFSAIVIANEAVTLAVYLYLKPSERRMQYSCYDDVCAGQTETSVDTVFPVDEWWGHSILAAFTVLQGVYLGVCVLSFLYRLLISRKFGSYDVYGLFNRDHFRSDNAYVMYAKVSLVHSVIVDVLPFFLLLYSYDRQFCDNLDRCGYQTRLTDRGQCTTLYNWIDQHGGQYTCKNTQGGTKFNGCEPVESSDCPPSLFGVPEVIILFRSALMLLVICLKIKGFSSGTWPTFDAAGNAHWKNNDDDDVLDRQGGMELDITFGR
eukprot:TRINITY_DN85243_c0_g1_i1.p1 TRINITY_DN85243_c0_g1~~TRINITY_DN85243_c0_g1_i1.p1  ORF type:complete len:291 (+),score=105.13 TRINITY_DN85243_c0_g1_i1:41-874(+)